MWLPHIHIQGFRKSVEKSVRWLHFNANPIIKSCTIQNYDRSFFVLHNYNGTPHMGGSIVRVQRHHSQGLCMSMKNFPSNRDVRKSKIYTAAHLGVVSLDSPLFKLAYVVQGQGWNAKMALNQAFLGRFRWNFVCSFLIDTRTVSTDKISTSLQRPKAARSKVKFPKI